MKLPAHIIALQEQTERINCMVRPPWLDMHEQMERTWAPLRHHLELMEKIKIDNAALRMHEIVESHQRLVDIAQATKENFRLVEDIKNSHRIWMETIRPLQDSLAHIRSAIEPLAGVSQYLTASEKLFACVDFDAIRRAYTLPNNLVLHTQRTLFNLANRYETLLGSVNTLPDLMKLPAYTLPSASREIFTAGYAFKRICIDEIAPDEEETALVRVVEQESSICRALLREVNPAFERLYIGARDALRGNNADRTRHILISLRELWANLLHRLAPDEQVWRWVDSQGVREQLCKKGELLYVKNGKEHLTRASRVRFVCRALENKSLSDFLVQDTRALVKLIEFFHRVHELEPELMDVQLRALLLRTDSWLMYILNIWKERE